MVASKFFVLFLVAVIVDFGKKEFIIMLFLGSYFHFYVTFSLFCHVLTLHFVAVVALTCLHYLWTCYSCMLWVGAEGRGSHHHPLPSRIGKLRGSSGGMKALLVLWQQFKTKEYLPTRLPSCMVSPLLH